MANLSVHDLFGTMSRVDQAISILQQGRPALLIDDFCPKFFGSLVFPCSEIAEGAVSSLSRLSNNEVLIVDKSDHSRFHNIKTMPVTHGGIISYCGPGEAAKELQTILSQNYMLISPCSNDSKQPASEKELRTLSSTHDIPPLFLTDVAKLCFKKEMEIAKTAAATIGEINFNQYSNPYNKCIHSIFIKGQVNQEAMHDFEAIGLTFKQDTKSIGAADLDSGEENVACLNNLSRGIFLHICQPESIVSEENRIFIIPAKILTQLGVKRIKISSAHKGTFQGTAAFGIEVTQDK